MTAEQSKKSPAKYWPIAVIALVLIVLAMKVSFIFVPAEYSPPDKEVPGHVYVIWNNADTARKFKTFDSLRASTERVAAIIAKEHNVEPLVEESYRKNYDMLKKSVEDATYLYSFYSKGR
ncbi:hypothetical protein ATN89_17615 [Comamonas thiooxydans]|uniref:hypothetical protein n=1 Tax=Comamonas thiooxydans TaxID=363952 RepID=UPI0007C4ECB0|nr:hypothetical protein [Comamonas thiooxydans]OAD82900.1 hypothetical protein ATN89_17615 [Comamonas thiooxydans]